MSKRIQFFILLAAIAFAISAWNTFSTPKQQRNTSVTAALTTSNTLLRPEFSGLDLEQKLRNIKEWDGKIIVLNFWATWCPPCRKEIPDLIELQNKYGASGIQVIGVAIDEVERVNQFAMDIGINYPTLMADINGFDLAKSYGNVLGALPFSAVINRDGIISSTHTGALSMEDLENIIKPLR